MRTLHRYVLRDYLVIYLSALGLVTFVMGIGAMLRAVDLMARGISGMLIFRFFLQNIPYILSFSMPISGLFSALLLFGRLSMDSEISAMKSCGISLWRLASPLVVLSILLTGICIYFNSELKPRAKQASRELLHSVGVAEPVKLLEEGRFITDFPGLMIYVGSKSGLKVSDIVAYELDRDGTVRRSVRAVSGTIEPDNEARVLTIHLNQVRIEVPDASRPHDITRTTYVNAEYYPVRLDFDALFSRGSTTLRRDHMNIPQLISRMRRIGDLYPQLNDREQLIQRSRYAIEANKRLSTAIGCFTFMLIGIPLGVKSHRKETSVGMVISLIIVFIFYLFIIIAETLTGRPEFYPNLILWLPMIGMQFLGLYLMRRSG